MKISLNIFRIEILKLWLLTSGPFGAADGATA